MGDASKLVTPKLDGKYHIYIYTYKNMKILIDRSNSQRPR